MNAQQVYVVLQGCVTAWKRAVAFATRAAAVSPARALLLLRLTAYRLNTFMQHVMLAIQGNVAPAFPRRQPGGSKR